MHRIRGMRCSTKMVLGSLLLAAGGCGAPRSTGPEAAAGKIAGCPDAEALWPVMHWSEETGRELAAQLGRSLLESSWLSQQLGQGSPVRLRLAGLRNHTSYSVRTPALTAFLEQALFASGKVTLVAPDELGGSSTFALFLLPTAATGAAWARRGCAELARPSSGPSLVTHGSCA